ncbi:MAG: putative mutator protein MutT4 [Candidatus Hydrogenedentota bacterium]|jgi:8-oxo-dGTP pyrophosphatase MutT (NUDIX family)
MENVVPVIDDSWYQRIPEVPERVSAGGVVVRIDRGNLLVALVCEIESRGETLPGYVLPKGGVEPGEDRETGARREIQEEAGLSEVTWIRPVATIERHDLYKKYWSISHYELFVTSQLAGEILDKDHHFGMDWFPLDQLPEMFWPCERHMLERRRKEIYDAVITHQNPYKRKGGFM